MHPYHHVKKPESGRQSVTVFLPGGAPVVASDEHPQFDAILEGAKSDLPAEELRGLADLSAAVAQRFDQLSERVSVAHGRVFFDGDEVDSAITQHIVRCLEDPSVGDWKPYVLFMENAAANQNAHSREMLFDWLRDREFTITGDGCFIAYKGVSPRGTGDDDEDAETAYPYQSSGQGEAIVNGERFVGHIPNAPGAVVEMPRSAVNHNPSQGCSTGLHVGTHKYAQGYASGALLTVLVNPRDVVSVPTDCNAEKMRVCRYTVADDDAKHPSELPAIADSAPEYRRLYPKMPGTRHEIFAGKDYFVDTGERGDVKDKFYLTDTGVVLYGFVGTGAPLPILEPTTPRHGDELVEDDEVEFYNAASGAWEAFESREDFDKACARN